MSDQEKDLDTLEKVKDELLRVAGGVNFFAANWALNLIARIPDTPASAPTLHAIGASIYRSAYLAGHHDTVEGMWTEGYEEEQARELINEHPEWSAPTPKRDDAGLRKAVEKIAGRCERWFTPDDWGAQYANGRMEAFRDAAEWLRLALAAHPAPSEPEREALRQLGWSMILGVPTYERVPGSDDWATVTNTVPIETWHAAIEEAKRQRVPEHCGAQTQPEAVKPADAGPRLPAEAIAALLALAERIEDDAADAVDDSQLCRDLAAELSGEFELAPEPAAPIESPWRPIEEAPDDDKRRVVLLPAAFYGSRVWVLRYSGSDIDQGWSMPGISGLYPTHFLDDDALPPLPPLPEPPQSLRPEPEDRDGE